MKYILKLIASIFCFIIVAFLGLVLVYNASNNQMSSNRPVTEKKNNSVIDIILSRIEDGQEEKAINKIKEMLDSPDQDISKELCNYFEKFNTCFMKTKNDVTDENQIDSYYIQDADTYYFINNYSCIQNYLQRNSNYGKYEAFRRSEIVPYYLIKNFNQNRKKQSSLYKYYIDVFSQNDSISRETADVICLYVQAFYKDNPWTGKKGDGYIKDEILYIDEIQKKFKRELSPDGGSYGVQALYLKNMADYLERTANRKFNWLKLENAPGYKISLQRIKK